VNATRPALFWTSVRNPHRRSSEITRYIVNIADFLDYWALSMGLPRLLPAVDRNDSAARATRRRGSTILLRGDDRTGIRRLARWVVAFGSSLLGLAGVAWLWGCLNSLQAPPHLGAPKTLLISEWKDWLSSITRVGFPSGGRRVGAGCLAGVCWIHHGEQMDSCRS